MESLSGTKLTFPKRPQISRNFNAKTMEFVTNHFTVSLSSNQTFIYLYDVKIFRVENGQDFLIEADARRERQDVISSCLKELKELFETNFCVSGQLLWSRKKHPNPKTIKTISKSKSYLIVFTKTLDVSLHAGAFQNNTIAGPARQFINTLIKKYFKKIGFTEWGRNSKFYDPMRMNKIEEFYLEIYSGFKTSCEVYQNYTLKILIDISSKIVRADSVLGYLKHEARSSQEAAEMLEGRSVIASYGNYRMWNIDYVDFTSNPTKVFEISDLAKGKRNISLAEYYREKYNLRVTDMKQPLLVSIDRKTKKKLLLIPEFVQMTGLDEKMRKDNSLMRKIAETTCLKPTPRVRRIKDHLVPLNNYLSEEYGIKMEAENVVKGYVLNTPNLNLGKKTIIPAKGNFQINDSLFKPIPLNNWLFVYAEECRSEANDFLGAIRKCSENLGIKISPPKKHIIEGKKAEALKEGIRNNLTPGIQIVVALFPPAAKKIFYEALKEVCCVEKGVQSQAVISSSLRKDKVMPVCSKILIQMNAKIGSALWVTEKPQGLPERTMIIGADVFHNTKMSQEKESCIGFCASLNPEFNQFFSKVCFQERMGKEIMTNIGKLVKEAVWAFFEFNGKKFFPEYIIFFRDGVGENQLDAVYEKEIQAIFAQLKTISENYNFKFAEIVVTKRIDDRIFTKVTNKNQTEYYNPPAGTVVASDIVSEGFDYFMVAQNVTQGTCTPTHYNVIYDSTGLSQDIFWNLTYSQCYNYYNWNGSVKVPAPVQYAHKLAYLVGQSVRECPDSRLDKTLYYL